MTKSTLSLKNLSILSLSKKSSHAITIALGFIKLILFLNNCALLLPTVSDNAINWRLILLKATSSLSIIISFPIPLRANDSTA